MRSGIWVYALIPLFLLYKSALSLNLIWLMWALGDLSSLVLSAYALKGMGWRQTWKSAIDWGFIRHGGLGSLPFFGFTLILILIEYSDRFFIKYYLGESMVGVYSFYYSIAGVVSAFTYTGIVSLLHPTIISSFKAGQLQEYRRSMRKLIVGVTLTSLALVIILAVGIYPVLMIVKNQIYGNYLVAFYVLLLATVVYSIWQGPYYGLYVRGLERDIFKGAIIAFTVSVVLNFLLIPSMGIKGAAISTCLGKATLLLVNLGYLKFKG